MQLNELNPGKITEAYSEIILTAAESEMAITWQKRAKQSELYHKECRKAIDAGENSPPRPSGSKEELDKVELSPEESGMALMRARQKKAAEIKQQQWAAKISQPITYTYPTIESLRESYLKRKDQYGNPFILDAYSEPVFNKLAMYFTKYKDSDLNPDKGIMLAGPVGCGKTEIMDFFKYNFYDSFIVVSCRDLTYSYSKLGDEAIKRYNGLIPFVDVHLSYGQNKVGVCFDDMGTEDDRKNYGNESNVMADVMLNRYDNKRNLIRKTHITTNLTTDEMEQRYGSRVRSRMREMFNLVTFDPIAADRRK
jgi:hypothetical protein